MPESPCPEHDVDCDCESCDERRRPEFADETYLGDSVYAAYDGYYLTLTTNNGEGPTNTIYMEPAVYQALVEFSREKMG